MSITAVIASVTAAADNAKKLLELSTTMRNVELKTAIADLMNAVADAKMQLAELKEEISALRAENDSLKAKRAEQSPTVKWGCYLFQGDDKLYCPGCYDTKGKKHLTTRLNSTRRQCPVCRAVIGS